MSSTIPIYETSLIIFHLLFFCCYFLYIATLSKFLHVPTQVVKCQCQNNPREMYACLFVDCKQQCIEYLLTDGHDNLNNMLVWSILSWFTIHQVTSVRRKMVIQRAHQRFLIELQPCSILHVVFLNKPFQYIISVVFINSETINKVSSLSRVHPPYFV